MTNFLKKIRRRLYRLIRAFWLYPVSFATRIRDREALKRFERLSGSFQEKYNKVSLIKSDHLTPLWQGFSARLETTLLPLPPADFLRDPVINASMVMTKEGTNLREEKAFIKKYWGDRVREVARENAVGNPSLVDGHLATSHNSIHHAFHIARFLDATGTNVNTIQRVVEWGGGYGNLAKIWRRTTKIPLSWVIFDIPLMSTLQWLYLSSILGEAKIRLITNPEEEILKDGITLIPMTFLDNHKIKADLFISTWAISESPEELQDRVIESRWFGARHLLIGYQDSNQALPDAGRIGAIAAQNGAMIEDIPALPGNHYAFR